VSPKEVEDLVKGSMRTQFDNLQYQIDSLKLQLEHLKTCPKDMVAAGTFCIDRYEASLDSPSLLGSLDGSKTTARAISDIALSQNQISWFQAAQACQNVGKRLCTRQEWLTAASGTPDPGSLEPGPNDCNIKSTEHIKSGQRTLCRSKIGAFDMIGNLAEWVDEWYVSGAPVETDPQIWHAQHKLEPWEKFGTDTKDATWNLNAHAQLNSGSFTPGMPAAAARGGSHLDAANAGRFALDLRYSPTTALPHIGFRCCRSIAYFQSP
jgi:hypothetical protein